MGAKNTQILMGIVIKADKVREADIRVKLLTVEGLKTFTATGAAKASAKLKHAVQLFTIAEFSVIGHRIVGAHVITPSHYITKNIKCYYLACAICEVVAQCHGAGMWKTLKALEALDDDHADTRAIFARYFSGLLVELGYDCEEGEDLNTAYARCLDIKIPNTKFFL